MSSSKTGLTSPLVDLVERLHLSQRDVEVAIMGYFCVKDEILIDYTKLEKLCGFKSTAVARNQWNLTKKKLNPEAAPAPQAAPNAGPAAAAADGDDVAVTPGPSTKRKRAFKKEEGAADPETPAKKRGRPSKKAQAAEVKAEEAVKAEDDVKQEDALDAVSAAGRNAVKLEEPKVEEEEAVPVVKKARASRAKKVPAAAVVKKQEEDADGEDVKTEPNSPVTAKKTRAPRVKKEKKAAPVAGPSMAAIDPAVKVEALPVKAEAEAEADGDEDAEGEDDVKVEEEAVDVKA